MPTLNETIKGQEGEERDRKSAQEYKKQENDGRVEEEEHVFGET